MKVDQYNVLIIEKDGPPGDLGDSCAETGRYTTMSLLVNFYPYGKRLNLLTFITSKGFIRHPDVPDDWKENDFTSDQGVNLLQALQLTNSYAFAEVSRRMKWRTAPSKISLPAVMATSRKMYRTLNWINAIQGLIFKLPLRWSDAKGWFDKSHDSSADYLNWIVTAAFLKLNGVKPILNVKRDVLVEKITSYHANQQNTSGILELYALVIEDLYK